MFGNGMASWFRLELEPFFLNSLNCAVIGFCLMLVWGYRWEFKKNVNVRLDYGFGKSGQSGFLFNINEAF